MRTAPTPSDSRPRNLRSVLALWVPLAAGQALLPTAVRPSPAWAQQDKAAEPAAPVIVTRADFSLRMQRDGRIESLHIARPAFEFEAYSGRLEVAEVAPFTGSVSAGQVLVRVTPTDWENTMRSAEENLADARQRLDWAEQELTMAQQRQAVALEQAEKSLKDSLADLMLWDKYRWPDAQLSNELSIQQSRFGLEDQRQELAQLEEMYRNTSLATETKDIVLDRARRGLKISEQWFEMTQHNNLIARDYSLPRQDRDTRDSARYAQQSHDHALQQQKISLEQQEQQTQGARRGLRAAEEYMAKLRRDHDALTLTAPFAGLATRINLAAGDRVSPGQPVCEIHNPNHLAVTFTADVADSRIIALGSDLDISFASFPELSLTAKVSEMSTVAGAPAGDPKSSSGSLEVRALLTAPNAVVRPGLSCSVSALKTIPAALAVPSECIGRDDDGAFVTVKTGADSSQRRIRVGPSSGGMTIILEGLAEGEAVVKP